MATLGEPMKKFCEVMQRYKDWPILPMACISCGKLAGGETGSAEIRVKRLPKNRIWVFLC
jgi:hypothetical protein